MNNVHNLLISEIGLSDRHYTFLDYCPLTYMVWLQTKHDLA